MLIQLLQMAKMNEARAEKLKQELQAERRKAVTVKEHMQTLEDSNEVWITFVAYVDGISCKFDHLQNKSWANNPCGNDN